MSDLRYRADIDGIRAVAILAVVIFHFFPKALPGGFVGVDVFFVISGFLITSIISRQLDHGNFSFAEFYVRRAQRLFPALVFMLTAVLILGWLYLIDIEFQSLGKHVLAAIFFVYNFVAKSESGYFSVDAIYKLVHHMWSLAVEEQFYLFYPVILIAAKKLRINLWKAVTFLIAISFILNAAQFMRAPKNVFYQPEYRMWELALGGLVSLRPFKIGPLLRNLLTTAAAMTLCVAFFLLSEKVPFPGYWALVPVLSTTLLIAASTGTHAEKLLSLRPLAWFGRISYPLYLWHWPLFSFACYFGYQQNSYVLAALMAASIALAGGTYEFIEKPLKKLKVRKVAFVSIGLLLVLAGFAFLIFKGIVKTRETKLTGPVSSAMLQYDPPKGSLEFRNYAVNVIEGKGALASQKVLLLGDSVGYQYYPRFEKLIPSLASSRSLYLLARGACPPIPGLHLANDGYCGYTDLILDYNAQEKFDVIVVAGHWRAYLGEKSQFKFRESSSPSDSLQRSILSLTQFLKKLRESGARVVVLQSNPMGDVLNPRNMIRRNLLHGFAIETPDLSLAKMMEVEGQSRTIISTIASNSKIQCLDPINALCSESTCPSVSKEGRPLYKDDVHLSPNTTKELTYLDFILTNEIPEVSTALRCK